MEPVPLHIGGAASGSKKKGRGSDAAGALDRFTTAFAKEQTADRDLAREMQKRREEEASRERSHQKELAGSCRQQ